jgi:hypothetical protein
MTLLQLLGLLIGLLILGMAGGGRMGLMLIVGLTMIVLTLNGVIDVAVPIIALVVLFGVIA